MDGRPQYEALPYVLSQDVQPCFDGDGDDINNIVDKRIEEQQILR